MKHGSDICKTCGIDIFWTADTSGKSIPLLSDGEEPIIYDDGDYIWVAEEPQLFGGFSRIRVEQLIEPTNEAIIYRSHLPECRKR